MITKNNFYYEYGDSLKYSIIICETSSEFVAKNQIINSSLIEEFDTLTDWWDPWANGIFNVSLDTDHVSGTKSFNISGHSDTSIYIGGTGKGLNWDTGLNWSNRDGIAINYKRNSFLGKLPKVRIEFVDVTTHNNDPNLDGGWYETKLDDCFLNWRELIIPFNNFNDISKMKLSEICKMKLHLKSEEVGDTLTPALIDYLRLINFSVINLDSNYKTKKEWLDQLFSKNDNDILSPKYVSIKKHFPMIKTICWFNICRYENCEVKDFTIPKELNNYINNLLPVEDDNNNYNYNNNLLIFPNPSEISYKIKYHLNQPDNVILSIENELGQQILLLENGIFKDNGNYEITIPNENLLPGIYFCVLKTSKIIEIQKLVVVK